MDSHRARWFLYCFAVLAISLASARTGQCADNAKGPIPIYVTPFYDSRGPTIAVGTYSRELKTADSDVILNVVNKMKEQWLELPVETMFVTAIRLYDLGHKDEAVYWFYSARQRQRLFRALLQKESIGGIGSAAFEHHQAQVAFQQLAGEYINGYAFGDIPKVRNAIKTVQAESQKLANLRAAYPNVKFVEESSWQQTNDEVAKQFDQLVEFIDKDADKIRAERKKNGIENKY